MMKALSILVVFVLVLSGCAGTEATRFYLLSPESKPPAVTGDMEKASVTIAVGSVRFPEYLNRPQIVTRLSENELEFGWSDRWAEPLERTFSRVLAQNIEQLLHSRCSSVPAPRSSRGVTYRIEVDVVRMDGILGEKACLDVWWSIGSPERKPFLTRRSSFAQPVRGRGYEAFVQAQSWALFDLSREIAIAIAGLTGKTEDGR